MEEALFDSSWGVTGKYLSSKNVKTGVGSSKVSGRCQYPTLVQ